MTFGKENFLDANVFVYANVPSAHTAVSRKYISGGGKTDALALIEAYAKIRTITKDAAHARNAIRTIMKQFEIVPVTNNTVFDAMTYPYLTIHDAVHLVCSEGCELITFDKDFKKQSTLALR